MKPLVNSQRASLLREYTEKVNRIARAAFFFPPPTPTKLRKWQTEGLRKRVNQSYSNLSGFRKHSVILLVEFTNLTALWNLISYLSENKLILWRSQIFSASILPCIKLDLQISSLEDRKEDVSYHIQEVLNLKSPDIGNNKQKQFLLIKVLAFFLCLFLVPVHQGCLQQ